nr:hypothetical protein CFP56_28553 [Quercus suber]
MADHGVSIATQCQRTGAPPARRRHCRLRPCLDNTLVVWGRKWCDGGQWESGFSVLAHGARNLPGGLSGKERGWRSTTKRACQGKVLARVAWASKRHETGPASQPPSIVCTVQYAAAAFPAVLGAARWPAPAHMCTRCEQSHPASRPGRWDGVDGWIIVSLSEQAGEGVDATGDLPALSSTTDTEDEVKGRMRLGEDVSQIPSLGWARVREWVSAGAFGIAAEPSGAAGPPTNDGRAMAGGWRWKVLAIPQLHASVAAAPCAVVRSRARRPSPVRDRRLHLLTHRLAASGAASLVT